MPFAGQETPGSDPRGMRNLTHRPASGDNVSTAFPPSLGTISGAAVSAAQDVVGETGQAGRLHPKPGGAACFNVCLACESAFRHTRQRP